MPFQNQDKGENTQNTTTGIQLGTVGLAEFVSSYITACLYITFYSFYMQNLRLAHSPVTFTMKYRVSLSRVLTAVQA